MANNYDSYSKQDLIQLLNKRDHERKLGLVWERDDIEHERTLNSDFVTLELDQELSVGEAPYRNLLIEGDNFDALRYLNIAYKGKVKCIYIDPPYNTGNKDWVYNDHYVDKTHSYRHSLWIESLYQRLTLAKDLLRQDGVIFMSIDDNEYAHAKLIMDKVFSAKNFLASLIWQTDGNFDNQGKIKIAHEYILAYAADEEHFPAPPMIEPYLDEDSKVFKDEIRNTIVKNGPKNPASSIVLPAGFPCEFEEGNLSCRTDKWPHILDEVQVENFELQNPVRVFSGWANKNLLNAFIDQGFSPVLDSKSQLTHFALDANGTIQNIKKRSENYSYVTSVIRNVGSVQKTATDLKRHYGFQFDYPKPISLIDYLLSFCDDPDGIFLDFYAGSGTLAKAVEYKNQQDSGNRRFILVSSTEKTADQPNKNVCLEITRARVAGQILNDKKVHPAERLSCDFAYMRSVRTPVEDMYDDIRHDQIWYTLQQIHFDGISPCQEGVEIQVLESEDLRLVYLAETTSTTLAALQELLDKDHKQTVVYSWQPGVVEQHCLHEHLQIERIPEYLTDRFGGGLV